MNIRALAAQTLAPVISGKSSLSNTIDSVQEQALTRDRSLFRELCLGSLRQYHRLNAITEQLLQKPLKSKDADIHALLIIGLYQLRSLRIPDHAAIAETVEAARQLKKDWATKLINGVLRNYIRNRKDTDQSLYSSSIYNYSHPKWLLKQLKKAWPENWENVVEANNSQPPISLRINLRRTSMVEVEKMLSANGIATQGVKFSDTGLMLQESSDITQLPGYQEGLFSVQDEAAQLSARLLSLAPGERVLDACCAPGGKTSHMLEMEPQIGEMWGLDIDQQRLDRVAENLARLGLNAHLVAADASAPEDWWDGKPFARILLDAPCSATGVIRRHPDIKLLRRSTDIDKLSQLQAQLLRKLWPTLLPGGVLLYATCSILPEENEKVVEAFVEETADALHDPIAANWGVERSYGRQLLPQVNGHDGFYYARIIKTR